MQKEKKKHNHKRILPKGCISGFLISIGILVSIPIVLFCVMWVFARYGGEWATANSIPIPEDSVFQISIYEYEYYVSKTSFYSYEGSPDLLRQWFIDAGISMTPIPLNMEHTSFIEYDDYYFTPPLFHMASPLDEFHDLSARIASHWWSDFTKTCQFVQIFQNNDAITQEYPEIDLSSVEGTVFAVRACWANVH